MRTSTRSGQPSVVENSPGRATAKARREALSNHGKRALTGNQDGFGGSVSGRAAARALREEKSRFGAKNLKQSSTPRPVRGARDASWKVASTMTEGGNEVSGTSVQHDPVMTGSDQGVCQAITGTDYLSGEAFENACLQPESSRRHATRLSDTLGGNTISGNELGAGEQLTGNRTGCVKRSLVLSIWPQDSFQSVTQEHGDTMDQVRLIKPPMACQSPEVSEIMQR